MSLFRPTTTLAVLCVVAAACAQSAAGSQLLERNTTNVRLKVSRDGKAMVSYRARGRAWDVLAWGAINALAPTTARKQVQFRIDRAGGWGTFGRKLRFANACRPYDGPRLVHLVTACKAPDGSYWALQRWQRWLPNLGFLPWKAGQRAWALHLSHWTGELAVLEGYTDWSWSGRFHHVFGRLTYKGKPVHGFKTTRYGSRLDKYGRIVYLDTFSSRYGPGWRRENSFVTHKPTGVFCYTFRARNPLKGGYTHPPGYRAGHRGPGNGEAYRMTVEGPGVTPDVKWEGKGLPRYNPHAAAHVEHERQMNAQLDLFNDRLCRKH
jgi:hypothetical protein